MNPSSGLDPRDPLRIAGARGDLAVERLRELQRHERCTGGNVLDVRLIQTACLLAQNVTGCLDTSASKLLCTASGHDGIGVRHGVHHPRDASVDDQIRARRRPAVMRARLQRNIERRTLRRVAGRVQRDDLRMGTTRAFVEPASDHSAVLNDDRADHRIGAGGTPPLLRKGQSLTHVRFVGQSAHLITSFLGTKNPQRARISSGMSQHSTRPMSFLLTSGL